jgi:hypothetical protein
MLAEHRDRPRVQSHHLETFTSTGIFGGMTHRERREWARSETFDIVDRSYTLQRTRQPSTR